MSTAAASPAASSSKRPAASAASTPAAKRARQSTVDHEMHEYEEDEELREIEPSEQNMTEEELAKKARREARTIRNRESAQRSRNQRKAHLAWLEARVVELEAENRALRSGSAPPTPSKTRESSPAHSVLSLASDLGIPPEIVSASGGVSLATVAPPSTDALTDIKPTVEAAPATPAPVATPLPAPMLSPMPPSNPAEMHVENAALRWRVSMLENIVKQAAHYFQSYTSSNGGPIPDALFPHAPFGHPHPAPGMELTLSPPLYPSDARQVASPLHLQTQLDNPHHPASHTQPSAPVEAGSSFVADLSNPLARHPAAVATLPAVSPSSERRGKALQRARGSLTGINLDSPANQRRTSSGLDLVVPYFETPAQHSGFAAQAPVSAPDAWFPEGTQAAAEWDQEMNDLLETLEGHNKPESAAPVAMAPESNIGGDNWAWEQALVDI